MTIFYARDEGKDSTSREKDVYLNTKLSEEERKMILDLPPNYTGKIPGKLELCKGMPVIMRKNDATVLGLTNGAEGVTVGWDSTNMAGRDYLDVLYVKLSNPVRPVNIGNLPTTVVPIVS